MKTEYVFYVIRINLKSHFESNRQDRWKKLIPNAAQQLFYVPHPPPTIIPSRKSLYNARLLLKYKTSGFFKIRDIHCTSISTHSHPY